MLVLTLILSSSSFLSFHSNILLSHVLLFFALTFFSLYLLILFIFTWTSLKYFCNILLLCWGFFSYIHITYCDHSIPAVKYSPLRWGGKFWDTHIPTKTCCLMPCKSAQNAPGVLFHESKISPFCAIISCSAAKALRWELLYFSLLSSFLKTQLTLT